MPSKPWREMTLPHYLMPDGGLLRCSQPGSPNGQTLVLKNYLDIPTLQDIKHQSCAHGHLAWLADVCYIDDGQDQWAVDLHHEGGWLDMAPPVVYPVGGISKNMRGLMNILWRIGNALLNGKSATYIPYPRIDRRIG